MSQVSSVNFEANLYTKMKTGTEVKKGEMLGYFLFGGSDFVMLFQKNVDFKLNVPKISKDDYKHVLMGEEYGRLTLAR
jgi:phosphatidylserine decarboxylase